VTILDVGNDPFVVISSVFSALNDCPARVSGLHDAHAHSRSTTTPAPARHACGLGGLDDLAGRVAIGRFPHSHASSSRPVGVPPGALGTEEPWDMEFSWDRQIRRCHGVAGGIGASSSPGQRWKIAQLELVFQQPSICKGRKDLTKRFGYQLNETTESPADSSTPLYERE
jgi:hypothetical protein